MGGEVFMTKNKIRNWKLDILRLDLPHTKTRKQALKVCVKAGISKGVFSLSRNYFTGVRAQIKYEAVYERSPVNVKIEQGSTLTFTRDLL